jgi:hypothetical protein
MTDDQNNVRVRRTPPAARRLTCGRFTLARSLCEKRLVGTPRPAAFLALRGAAVPCGGQRQRCMPRRSSRELGVCCAPSARGATVDAHMIRVLARDARED